MSLFLILALITASHCFYLPGVAPHDFAVGDPVPLLVNALSAKDSLISYDYYYAQFHFCMPSGGPVAQGESLGSILFGDRLYSSPFQVNTTIRSC